MAMNTTIDGKFRYKVNYSSNGAIENIDICEIVHADLMTAGSEDVYNRIKQDERPDL